MPTNNHNLLLSRTLQYFGIILIVAAMGGGYWYWKNAKAAQQVTDNRPSFEAPLVTDLNLTAGQGTATYSRADGADRRATVTDFEGRIIPVKQNEARFDGARRVENLNPKSESDSGWTAGGTTPPTVNTSVSFGGKMAVSATFPTGVNGYAASRAIGSNFPVKLNSRYISNYMIAADRALTGSESITVYVTGIVGLSSVTFSTSKQLTTAWARYASGVSTNGVGDGNDYFTVMPGSNLSTPITIYLSERQIEEVTGQSNQNPSEYVSTNVKTAFPYHGAGVDGVKYFDTQNGNTVASNVVTEVAGAAIPTATLKGYLAEGSRTNLLTYSENLNDASWTQSRLTMTANAAIAPNGQTVAEKLIEGIETATHRAYKTVTKAASPLQYTVSMYMKKSERTKGGIRIAENGETDNATITVDLVTGSTSTTTSGGFTSASGAATSVGNDWWRVQLTATTVSTVSLTAYIMPANASGNLSYTGDGTSGIYVWGAQLEQAPFASSYIPTTTASVTRGTDLLSYPSSNADPTTGSAFAEVQSEHGRLANPNVNTAAVAVGGNSGRLIGATFAANASQVYAYDGTTAVQRASGGTFATMQRVASKWSGATYSVYKNATSASGAFDGAMASGVVYIGSYGSAASSNYGTVKNVRIWKKALSDTELQNMTSTTEGIATSAVKKTTIANTPSNTGLVGYWSFEDGSGTRAEDFSPTGTNTGTLTNGPTWVDGKIGKALSFNGSSMYVDAGNGTPLQITGTITISSWVKTTDLSGTQNRGIAAKYRNQTGYVNQRAYEFYQNNNTDKFGFAISVDGTGVSKAVETTTTISTGIWYHVVTVFVPSESIKMYLNGVLDTTDTTSIPASINNSSAPLWIGAQYDLTNSGLYFPGSIDEVRIYNRALSQSEIADLYQQGGTGKTTVNASQNNQLTSGLVGLWSFNGSDLSGTTAYDRSGQGNNGTLTNGPSVYPGKVGQALNFDGTNDYVSLPALPSVTAPYSVSFWMKPTGGLSSGNTVVSLRGANSFPKFLLMTNNKLLAYAGGEKYRYGTRVFSSSDLNTWWHVVFVVADSAALTNWKIYLNGIDDTGTPGANTGLYYDPSTFGTVGNDIAGQYFDGALDEVRIYNRALSASEVAALYQMGR